MVNKFFLTLIVILSFSAVLIACEDDDVQKLPLGSPCDETSNCEGVCDTTLPDGMCVVPCDEANPCDTGACVESGGLAFCMPACKENSECRDGYSCIFQTCRLQSQLGEPCDDRGDCQLIMEKKRGHGASAASWLPAALLDECPVPTPETNPSCIENFCSRPCDDESWCTDGFTCGLSNGCNYCVPE